MPAIPEPPRFAPDPRQQRASRVVGGITHQPASASASEPEPGPVVRTGYPAAAVDLGALQRAIEEGLRGFKLASIAERWNEVEEWLGQCTRTWVQRCKGKNFTLGEHSIEIALETQDDYGYYRYAFDVFSESKRHDARTPRP
jgi:hypothetical protein